METIDCYYWNPELGLEHELEFEYEEVNEDIALKKPIFTEEALSTIVSGIKEAREQLRGMDVASILAAIGQVTDRWKDPAYEGRQTALHVLPAVTGFSRKMIESLGFNQLLRGLETQNLPLAGVLDPTAYREFSEAEDGLMKAFGQPGTPRDIHPEVVGHICAGNILGISAMEMAMDKLIDAASWVKVPTEQPVFGALYAASMEEVAPILAHTIAVLPFKSDEKHIQEFLFARSDIVRATGGERARTEISKLAADRGVPLAGHWHKYSFITVAREYLNRRTRDIAELVSFDVSAWDQQGCFSPQEIFVERGGAVSPAAFAALLAEEMEHTTEGLPKGGRTGKINVVDTYLDFVRFIF